MSYGTIANRQDFQTALELTEEDKRLLVVWCHATWCGECKQIKPTIDAMTQELGEDRSVYWFKMNIEEATAVCDEYGISDTPVFMIFRSGDFLPETKVMGMATERLKREIQKLLPENAKFEPSPSSAELVQMTPETKTVLITGCSAGGLGDGLAESFRDKGYHVFATARTPSKISKSLTEAPNVTILTLDVLSSEAIAAAVENVTKITGGKLDVLVNNSGTLMVMPGLDISIEEAKKTFDTNFWAYLAMIQAFAPLLIKVNGAIVNNTSASGVVPFGSFMSVYNSSKAAAILGSETWRLELAPLGVRTLTLVTTGVKSNSFANLELPKIPEGSYYRGLQGYIEEQSDGRLQANGITGKQFGDRVVREVERGTTGKFWVGGGAASARYGVKLLPGWLMDMLLASLFPYAKLLKQQANSKE
ncbi:hypothetical protein H2200_011435 [Cladophialophora chaetospira]|uniref:Thioredoxin domain-containing protein n=1 Tax=Cladophialophora chaetospira TaxID=386627 RepID=A0AA38WZE4_9EURO|nr:hypothetical protein H2200_011435 [Cladophialophora chaetospira]